MLLYKPRPQFKNGISIAVELLSFLNLFVEIFVVAYIARTVVVYFTLDDEESWAIILVGIIHLTFVIVVGVYHVLLIQYLRNQISLTLKEYDRVANMMLVGVIEELVMLLGVSLLTYYILYVLEFEPAFDTIILIQLLVLGKALLNVVHYTLFLQIEHQHDPNYMMLIPVV